MNQQTVTGWTLLSLLMSTLVLSYPQSPPVASSRIAAQYIPKSVPASGATTAIEQQQQQFMRHAPQHYRVHGVQGSTHDRKFAEKPNALKKVALENVDDLETNQIQENGWNSGWSSMLGSLMQMIFNAQAGGGNFAPSKSDDFDTTSQIPPSPWTNVIAVGE